MNSHVAQCPQRYLPASQRVDPKSEERASFRVLTAVMLCIAPPAGSNVCLSLGIRVSRLPRVATSVYPSVSAYQGATLVGPLRPNPDLGF
jgi:hypothetical protein